MCFFGGGRGNYVDRNNVDRNKVDRNDKSVDVAPVYVFPL